MKRYPSAPSVESIKAAADKAERMECDSQGRPGRPSKYSPAIVDEICVRIAEGQSLRAICEDNSMPDRKTIHRWLDAHREFATKYARARELQADAMDDKILSVADACTSETAAADRVKIMAYQWRASKLAPKKYGDKVVNEIVGANGGPIETKDVSARDLLAGKLASLSARGGADGDSRKPH